MRFRKLLTISVVIATVGAAAFAAQNLAYASVSTSARATATITGAPTVPGLDIHPLSLHKQFAAAQTHITSGPRAGITPMTTEKHTAAATAAASTAAATCKEPDCAVSRHGGPVQHSPHVYLLLWGPDWGTSGSSANSVASYLAAFYSGLGQTSRDSWSTITSQYSDATGHPTFGQPVLNPSTDVYNDTSTPPSDVTPDDIASEAGGFATSVGITDTADAQVVVAFESGTCFSDGFGGNCGSEQSSGYCGWHSAAISSTNSSVYVPFINLPWQLDAGTGCGANFVNKGSAGLDDGWSIIGGHEYAETVTDPNPPTGYIDTADENVSGGEIADKCAWGGLPFGVFDPFGDVTLTTGSFAMQSLWSNSGDRCIMTSSPTLTVTTPATQKSTLGRAVSLQISSATNTHVRSSFKATGLPPGLSISSTTGKISGTPNTTAGTYTTKVTVSDYAKSVSVSFSWQVSSTAGEIKGNGSKCVADSGGRTTGGNKIEIWTCNGGTAQRITFTASRQLLVVGRCITGGSIDVFIEPCSNVTNKSWTRLSNGEYVLKSSGKCLTEPSTTNGRQLLVTACRNTANQHWSLP